MAESAIKKCEACGANVYPEHLEKGRAGHVEGKLLCPICFQEKKAAESGEAPPTDDELASLSLVDDEEATEEAKSAEAVSKIRSFGAGTIGAAQKVGYDDSKLHRRVHETGGGATRCRTFHSKLNESAIAYMHEQVNEWVDSHDEIDIKFATSTIGIFEGKQKDPHLILTLFY